MPNLARLLAMKQCRDLGTSRSAGLRRLHGSASTASSRPIYLAR
ncbi:hypothetical protein M3J09_000352 [Ascochyta lentis]